MNQYTVRSGQNIYDIALALHGTVEGIFDLLVSNPELSMDTKLKPGDVLDYNEEFMVNLDVYTWLQNNKITVKNGDHAFDAIDIEGVMKQHIYSHHKEKYDELEYMSPDERDIYWADMTRPRMIILQQGKLSSLTFWLHPNKHLIIDWGDYSPFEVFDASESEVTAEHCYKSDGRHKIIIYGDFSLYSLDLTDIRGVYYALNEIYVDHLESAINNEELNKLIIAE